MPMPNPDTIRKSLIFKVEEERYYFLRKRGILFLDDPIDESVVYNIYRDLVYLSHEPSCALEKLWIVLNSPGGDVLFGFGVYDSIKASKIETNILGIGMVASMAAVIMQAGAKRLALPNTQFLLHQISETIFFKNEEVNEGKERIEELERLNRITMSIIAERSGTDVEELLRQTHKKDLWLDCESALKLGKHGLIDEVITTFPF